MFNLFLPGSKSITNRVVALAGMSREPIRIENFLFSEDTAAGLECLRKLGFDVRMDPAVKPRDDTVKPRDDKVKPRDDTVKPRDDTVKPRDDTVKPRDDKVKPRDDTVKPRDDTVKPRDDTVKPRDDTVKPRLDTAEPLDDTAISMSSRGLTAGSILISPPDFKKRNAKNFYDQIFELNMGNAGTIARFFPAVVLNWTKTFPESKPIQVLFHANPQLQKRPLTPLIHALKTLKASIEGETYPFKISSSHLSGETEINTEQSSQFLSGLLMAGYGAHHDIRIKRTSVLPQRDYVSMTLEILKKFGAHIRHSKDLTEFSLTASVEKLTCQEFFIEPDASTACSYLALAFLHNFSLTIEGLGKNSLQPDILFCDFLKKMGAHIKLDEKKIVIDKRTESKINGGFSYDFSLMSDQALIAGILALFADAPIEITGIEHIRYHECDRISCLAHNFKKFGFLLYEKKDGFMISPTYNRPQEVSGVWETHDDHRFAMSGFLLQSFNPAVIIEKPECVAKTAPTFFKDAKLLMCKNIIMGES